MTERQFASDPWVIGCLSARYGIEVKSMAPLSGGADMNAAIYKVQAADNTSYFVKLKRGHDTDINVRILELLHGHGVEQIISPVKTIQGLSILQEGDFCLIVYPFVEGVNGFSRKLTDKQWIMLGKALRQVHGFEVPASLLKDIRQETYSPKWRQATRALYAHLENEPAPHDAIALKFVNCLREHRLRIQRLVDRAEDLSHAVRKQPAQYVLCHSDIHGGNVLMKGRDTLYIVDWDDPIMAPKERDLMFIGGGVANVWNDPHEEACFYQGYGRADINRALLAYYRHERIVQDIAEYGQALLLSAFDSSEESRAEMYEHFMAMFDPQGVVDIAFETDVTSQT